MRIDTSCHVAAPPERVFAIAIDIPRWPERISAIDRIELLTPGPVGVGTRFRETRTMHGREASEEMTFESIDPPRTFVLVAESHGARYRAEHTFDPEGDGTRLTLTFESVPVTLAARLLTPLALIMRGPLRRQLAQDLSDLKRAAELS
jgi:carbon monoxide dehydrogenase subunit G